MADIEQASTPTSGNTVNGVTLRVIALAHSTNENEDVAVVTDLDTTVSQLKQKLQEHLSQHPRPETQRLIYQGRPLTDGNASLRQILRLEPASPRHSSPHVLHLVVRDEQSTLPSRTNRPPPEQSHDTPPNTTSTPQVQNNGPIPAAFGLAQQAFPQGHPAQSILQNAMQQHMAIHNHHHHNAHHTHLPLPTFNIPQPPMGQNGSLSPSNVSSEQPSNPLPPPTIDSSVPSGGTPVTNSQGFPHSSMTMTVEETVGPNGERIRRVVQNGQPLPVPSVPVERSASAPGLHPGGPLTPARSGLAHPPLPAVMPRMSLPQLVNFQQHLARLPTIPPGNVVFGHAQLMPQVRDPLVYLLSSSTGPEALLFTPNHGFFTSQQTNTTQPMTQTHSNNAEVQAQPPQPTPTQPVQQNAAPRNVQPNQLALRPQAPARGQAPPQPGRREGEEILAQMFQRGWLFLRLYMFIFVLSEPATWRRYVLLLIASLVCLLPRNNPFTDLLLAARRHFDNLIGPPPPPARPARQQGDDPQIAPNDATTTVGNNGSETIPRHRSTDSRMPTPEEHARRLLREHEQRTPNTVRDTLYRIEQAVALFLASLIPGVGERHVRAREEARRVVQEEEERRRREEEERQQALAAEEISKPEGTPTVSSEPTSIQDSGSAATSTGVEPTSINNGLRMRADAGGQGS